EGVKEIWFEAFKGCVSLTSIVIPEGVEMLDSGLFKGCKALKTVVIPGSVDDIFDDAFEGCPNVTIHAPAGSEAENFAKEKKIPFQAK
ncbi:MAG: leucine-rich repeat protein, partial [Thermoguttaceae bacterium]